MSVLTQGTPARSQLEQAGMFWSHRCFRERHRLQAVTFVRLTFERRLK